MYRGSAVFHFTFFCSLKNCSLIHFFSKIIFLCETAGCKKCSETNEISQNHTDSQRQSLKSYTETRVTKNPSRKQLPEALPYLFFLLRNYAVSRQVRAAVHRILLFHHSAVTGFSFIDPEQIQFTIIIYSDLPVFHPWIISNTQKKELLRSITLMPILYKAHTLQFSY